MNNDRELFRQALQRQNERAERMKMPDDMEQQVMERIRPKKANRRRLYPSIAAVAASVLLLLVFHLSQNSAEEEPAVAEVVEKNTQQPVTPSAEIEKEKEMVAEAQQTPPPVKKQQKGARKHATQEEPLLVQAESKALLAETVPKQEEPADTSGTAPAHHPSMHDPFHLAAAQAQDIRSRGERLHQEIALLMNNP